MDLPVGAVCNHLPDTGIIPRPAPSHHPPARCARVLRRGFILNNIPSITTKVKGVGLIFGEMCGMGGSMENVMKVIAGAPDKPLVIGGIEIPCYVLEDETRVITQVGVLTTIHRTYGGTTFAGSKSDCGENPVFAAPKWLMPFASKELTTVAKTRIRFLRPGGGIAYGYPATILEELCQAVLAADQAGATTRRQAGIVKRARVLHRGFARVGLIALIDERTEFQGRRSPRSLSDIFDKFLEKALRPWTKTFPDEFYEQICRLKGWDLDYAVHRPGVIGNITNDIVYDRLAPGVLGELRRRNPRNPDTGNRSHKHHQWLTADIGHPKLREHLIGVMALMRSCNLWREFEQLLWRSYPSQNETQPLPLAVA